MRHLVRLAAFSLLTVACAPACASGLDGKTPDQQSIDALEARAQQAPPREQCFLYAELVHQMTEVSVRQYAAGDVEKSASLLRHIQQLAHNMHLSMADDNKRLKNAEILLRHTAFRLTEMLHASSLEDRPLVEETLVQVNQAQTDAMMQVFRK
jgi:methylphosphotriester-DNA--protein-cysteine methyltransferase